MARTTQVWRLGGSARPPKRRNQPLSETIMTTPLAQSPPLPGSASSKALRVPKRRPKKWEVGDIAIQYITLRRDDDPMPPCILLMVVGVDGDKCRLENLDSNDSMTKPGQQLMGVEEAVAYFDDLAEELTVKSARLGRQKLQALAEPFPPFPEWLKSLQWWDAHPEDRPDDYALIRDVLEQNVVVRDRL